MLINLKKGWSVIQDVHGVGECYEIYKRDFDPTFYGANMTAMEPWRPVKRLEHLQLTLADNPYYGFGLRQFNAAPWWYRNGFDVPGCGEYAALTFKGVDYYADVWLNETYLGHHEGYNNPFTFDVSGILKEKDNLLVVKVSAPLENEVVEGKEKNRCVWVLRNQMKGTYEHADTFLPRDVNPVGIWNDVLIELYDGVRLEEDPNVPYELAEDYGSAAVRPSFVLFSQTAEDVEYSIQIREEDGVRTAAGSEGILHLEKGRNILEKEMVIDSPRLWTVWERGCPSLYEVTLRLEKGGKTILTAGRTFGLRRIELFRDEKEMYFRLNGEKLYLRGATYFPDVYISANHPDLYRRDIENAKRCGLNSWRIHVHTEKDELYDLCDREGILLIQDSDFNWVHPTDEEWSEKAVGIFAETVKRLRTHPSVFCYVLLNEARMESYLTLRPGPQLMEMVERLAPGTPYILNSRSANEPHSGDSHNYRGSIGGFQTHYTDIHDTVEKFNTEFGIDAPPAFPSLRKYPELAEILENVTDGIGSIQNYQYRLIKYYVEHYRIMKFAPCGGHYQFLFTDTAPTCQFGLYDHEGIPKSAQRALLESNQPLAVMMDHTREKPVAVWVVNDLLRSYEGAAVETLIWDDQENIVLEQSKTIDIKENDRTFVSSLDLSPDKERDYTVRLRVIGADGRILAQNRYESAFRHPDHVAGHPFKVHHGLSLRTYWAWL